MKKTIKKAILSFAGAFVSGLIFAGCAGPGSEPVPTATPMPTPEPIIEKVYVTATPTPSPTPTEVPWDGKRFTIDAEETYQTIEGIGAAYTWYSDWINVVDEQDGVFDALFKDAKLTVLRFKNEYEYKKDGEAPNWEAMKRYYDEAVKRAAEYGEKPIILLSCWSPKAALKENNDLTGNATLKKNDKGEFVYDEYAAWWVESVKYYESKGIHIDYISLQNEIDFAPSYDGCPFGTEETETTPSYAKAFLAVYRAFKAEMGDERPKMLAPETMSCKQTNIFPYIKDILKEEPDSIDGLGYHLYVGGEGSDETNITDPKSFTTEFMSLNNMYPDMSKWQTEYYIGHAIQTANLVNNFFLYGNGNAYIYWSGVWEDWREGFENTKLIGMIYEKHKRVSTTGWRICADYYALRHFSEYIRPGFTRVKTVTGNASVNGSAYISPDGKQLVAVIINNSDEKQDYLVSVKGFTFHDAEVFRSIFGEECKVATECFQRQGYIYPETVITLEPYSVYTVVIQ